MTGEVAVLAAVRTPWCLRGGAMASVPAADLGAVVAREVLLTAAIRPEQVQALVVGVASQSQAAGDLARDIGLRSELQCPAHAVSMGWISGERALATAVDAIVSGRSELVAAVGVETPSDTAVKMTRGLREALTEVRRAKGTADAVRALASLRPADLALTFARPIDPATGDSPTAGAEILAKRYEIDRPEQDRYALRSHVRTVEWSRRRDLGWVVPVPVPGPLGVQIVQHDEGPEPELRMRDLEQLQPLPPIDPAFSVTQRLATVTAGNAAAEADGAAAVLLGDLETARENGWPIRAVVQSHRFATVDPYQDPLMGAAAAIEALVAEAELQPAAVPVLELHEAFAVQVLATIRRVGLDPEAVNRWGGSIALGHPAGATGLRLAATAVERMRTDRAKQAVVAGSGLGGQGAAILLGSATS